MADALGTPIRGVTLYSFTRAFHGREYDLDGLIRKVAADGRGPGVEIIGFSSFRGFPHVTDEYAAGFRDLVDGVGLVPTSLAINTDVGIRRDRLMTDDELVEYMRRQIEAAAKLGFPIARVQISLTPDAMELLLPVAERYGVTLALEVHAHQPGTRRSWRCATGTRSWDRHCSDSPPTGARPLRASRRPLWRHTGGAARARSSPMPRQRSGRTTTARARR